ncbi:MAG: rhodanese-like domain-containing protein [Chitinophagaceae bacterium]
MGNISVEDLKMRLDQGEDLHLLDVREPFEHAEFNIGGTLLPLGAIKVMAIEEIEDWKQQEVIVYCRSGNRSAQACQLLEMQGFTGTRNLMGGMLAWQKNKE